jgi:gamma-glutamylcyclotransferase (GGCT)/AIG2-like uncharacterized protein YtfP
VHLFLYGVLREGPGTWPFLAGLGPGRPATTTGELFAIPDPHGWYPALRHGQSPGWRTIAGAVHRADDVDLAAVDGFEGADYERRAIPVRVQGETLRADAYLWAASLPADAERIGHGDFVRWLGETGRAAYAGA